jgi:hypothetical protein
VNADSATGPSAIEQIDVALEVEMKARRALLAIGEQWMLLRKAGGEPTDEEHALHAHLVQRWRDASHVLSELLERPLGQHL